MLACELEHWGAGLGDLMGLMTIQKSQLNPCWGSAGAYMRVGASSMQLRRWIRKQCGDGIRLYDDSLGARANDEPSFGASVQISERANKLISNPGVSLEIVPPVKQAGSYNFPQAKVSRSQCNIGFVRDGHHVIAA